MQVLEKNRQEVQARAEKMSDFLRMEYLENVTKKLNDIEVLRYCYAELCRLYEERRMFPEAVKYIAKFQEICISQKEKVGAYVKEAEILIKGGFYDRADQAYKRAAELINERDRQEIRARIIHLYKDEADKSERSNRISIALRIYEKLLTLVSETEKPEIKDKLLTTYKKLGRVKESLELEKNMKR